MGSRVDPRSPGAARVEEARHQPLTYRPELDGIRGIAILLVMAAHFQVPGVTNAGMVGVTLFFVLSGYLITKLLVIERDATGRLAFRRFYERRIRRLLPGLIALLAVTGAFAGALGHGADYPGQVLAALLYVANIARSMGQSLGMLGHTWSLSLEEQFYLLWPVTFVLAPRRWLPAVLLAGIAWSITAQLVLTSVPFFDLRPDVRGDALLWGCLIGLVPLRLPRWTTLLGWGVLLALSVVSSTPVQFAAASIAGVLVVVGAGPGFLAWRPLARIGELSYGLYLWHLVAATLVWDGIVSGIPLLVAASTLAALAIALVLALVSERWIERPFRRRRSDLCDPDVGGHVVPADARIGTETAGA